MINKIISSEINGPKMKKDNHKFIIFSVREVKPNPFRYFDEGIDKVVDFGNEINLDYKIEMAMEYELIYNSHFFDK